MQNWLTELLIYFYLGNILIATFSYASQQKILLDMIRGKRPVSRDISLSQYWIWSGANGITALYALCVIQTDVPFIALSIINFLNSTFTALLNSYVHFIFHKRILDHE